MSPRTSCSSMLKPGFASPTSIYAHVGTAVLRHVKGMKPERPAFVSIDEEGRVSLPSYHARSVTSMSSLQQAAATYKALPPAGGHCRPGRPPARFRRRRRGSTGPGGCSRGFAEDRSCNAGKAPSHGVSYFALLLLCKRRRLLDMPILQHHSEDQTRPESWHMHHPGRSPREDQIPDGIVRHVQTIPISGLPGRS